MPSYEVPHPALSTAAISQGKGEHRFCILCASAWLETHPESQMGTKSPK